MSARVISKEAALRHYRQLAVEATGATWADLPAMIRRLGMPRATEDVAKVLSAIAFVVTASEPIDDPEDFIGYLDQATDAVECLRWDERTDEQKVADAREADAELREDDLRRSA